MLRLHLQTVLKISTVKTPSTAAFNDIEPHLGSMWSNPSGTLYLCEGNLLEGTPGMGDLRVQVIIVTAACSEHVIPALFTATDSAG